MNTCAFSKADTLKQRALTPTIRRYFFVDASQVFIMFWHDFEQGGGSAIDAMFMRRGRLCVVSLALLSVDKEYLRTKQVLTA